VDLWKILVKILIFSLIWLYSSVETVMASNPRSSPDTAEADSAEAIYYELRRQLVSGELPAGSRLPSLRTMARQFHATINHAQRAVQRLRQEQLIETRHGSGIYVPDAATRVRHILLVSPHTGDEWSDYTWAVSRLFSCDARTRLMIESAPTCHKDQPEHVAFRRKMHEIITGGVDAVLFNGLIEMQLEFLCDYVDRVPLICFASDEAIAQHIPCSRVVSDWHHGGYIGMRHLIEVGCENIVVTRHSSSPYGILRHLLDGIDAAAADSIRPVNIKPFLASTSYSTEQIDQQIDELFDGDVRPDGVFAHADWLAVRMIARLQRRGLRVPEDVAVLGYYDTSWAMMTDPPLSSVSTNSQEVVQAIKEILDGRRFKESRTIRPRLSIRGSTQRS